MAETTNHDPRWAICECGHKHPAYLLDGVIQQSGWCKEQGCVCQAYRPIPPSSGRAPVCANCGHKILAHQYGRGPCDLCDCQGIAPTASAPPRTEAPETRDSFTDTVLEVSALVRACCKGYGEPVPFMALHDLSKRLYRMGYRKSAEPELDTCRRCGAENVITSQSVCLKCVGLPSYPLNHV